MTASSRSLTIDEIISRVTAEAERRRQLASKAPVAPQPPFSARPGAGFATASHAAPQIPAKKKYALDEFLRLGDEAFVRAAYQGLLRREPDPKGLDGYLERLRSGRASKTDILISIRWSAEGQSHGVKVSGLKRLRRLRSVTRVPVLGPGLVWLSTLGRLPQLSREIRRLHARSEQAGASWERVADHLQQRDRIRDDSILTIRDHVEEVGAASTSAAADLQRQLSEGLRQVAELRDRHEAGLRETEARLQDQTGELGKTKTQLQSLARELRAMRADLSANQRRLMSLLEMQLAGAAEAGGSNAAVSAENLPDELYVDFENLFRADFAEVRERLSLYKPLVEQACEATDSKRLLDLGCGRGEWLDLFTSAGYEASGVDLNASMVDLCLAMKLQAMEGDVLTELLRLPDASFAVVSMFHLVEHLPFGTVVRVIDEILRVLKPGGMAIFETPNPRNILVGSGDFYRDPTHRNPVFPDTLAWLGHARGFDDSRIAFVDYAGRRLIPADEWSFASLDDYVSIPRDYAWIGTKG